MKTVLFYSYKGGQGRSTAAANVASFLYRLGRPTLIADLDVDSPGLPSKLAGTSVFSPESELAGIPGLVSYICQLHGAPAGGRPPSIEDYLHNVVFDDKNIRLLQAGFVGKQYRRDLASREWSEFAAGGFTHLLQRTQTFNQVIDAITRTRPAPEYLFVDLGSGLTELARLILLGCAGTVVLFFAADQENTDGIRHILDFLNELPGHRQEARLPDVPLQVFPVLSRPGPFLSDEQLSSVLERTRRELHLAADTPLLCLRTDPDLEAAWYLHCPLDGPVVDAPLTFDYLKLIATVTPEVTSGATVDLRVGSLSNRFGLPERPTVNYKVFRRLENGVMLNMSDDERNVSFKVKTFCGLLDDLHRNLLRRDAQDEVSATDLALAEQRFQRAARATGEDFGVQLRNVWRRKHADDQDSIDRERLLQYWCEFDSEIGFGNLSYQLTNREPFSGSIKIRQNFLAADRPSSTKDADLCQLLVGYTSGVLSRVLGLDVAVSHDKSQCMRINKSRTDCEFAFVAGAATGNTSSGSRR